MDKKHCEGCYNNDYNYGLGGAKKCFSLDSAKLVKKYVFHKDLRPPFKKHHIKKVPDCYSPQHYAVVDPESIDSKGYWKS